MPKPLDEHLFYACSPHRIEMTAHLIRDQYRAEHANAALLLDDETAKRGADRDDGPFRRRE